MNSEDTSHGQLGPVSPYSTQRRRYKPAVGQEITVDLPGERIRAKIEGVVNEDACVAVILGTPIAKTPHGCAKGDMICVRRGDDTIGMESWLMISERELQQRETVARFEADERAKADEAEKERIAEVRAADLAAQDEAAAKAKEAATPWYKRQRGGTQP